MKKYLFYLAFSFSFAILNAQTVIWADDFNDEDISDWTLYDEDGDGFNWYSVQIIDEDGSPVDTPVLTSLSWIFGIPLSPDNWAVSPAIDLTSVSGDITLTWYVKASDPIYNQDKYSVYVATSNSVAELTAGGALHTEDELPAEFEARTLNLSSFAGSVIYIGFRHYDVIDQFRIVIDDVSVSVTETSEGCLDAPYGQFPTSDYTPSCNGQPENITYYGWFGEYSKLNVTSGTEYIFSTDVSSAYITISDGDGQNVLATGTGMVTWTATSTGTIRFYSHENENCLSSQNWVERWVQCGELPPPPANCEDHVVDSNDFENAVFFGGVDNQRLAVDIPVLDTGFDVFGLTLNAFETNPGNSTFSAHFYSDNNGIPGTLLNSIECSVVESVYVGTTEIYDIYTYTLAFSESISLNANTTYWMEIESNAFAWEISSEKIIGSGLAYLNNNTFGEWYIADEYEMVYALICEELNTNELNSFDFSYYPNPVKDELNITSKKNINSLGVYNLTGQKVMSKTNVSNGKVDVSALSPGVYIFRIMLEGGQVETFKIVKQ